MVFDARGKEYPDQLILNKENYIETNVIDWWTSESIPPEDYLIDGEETITD